MNCKKEREISRDKGGRKKGGKEGTKSAVAMISKEWNVPKKRKAEETSHAYRITRWQVTVAAQCPALPCSTLPLCNVPWRPCCLLPLRSLSQTNFNSSALLTYSPRSPTLYFHVLACLSTILPHILSPASILTSCLSKASLVHSFTHTITSLSQSVLSFSVCLPTHTLLYHSSYHNTLTHSFHPLTHTQSSSFSHVFCCFLPPISLSHTR